MAPAAGLEPAVGLSPLLLNRQASATNSTTPEYEMVRETGLEPVRGYPVRSTVENATNYALLANIQLSKNKKAAGFPRRSLPALIAVLHSKTSREPVGLPILLILVVINGDHEFFSPLHIR